MTDNVELTPLVRLAGIVNTLRPAELKVADLLQKSPGTIVERTAQEVADHIGIARTSVIRSVQALGYAGYAQFRVAVARQLAAERADAPIDVDGETGMLGALRGDIQRFAHGLPHTLGLLTQENVEHAVETLVGARRVQCVANGLSAPLAADLSMRLTAAGRISDFTADALAQQIVARQLGAGDVLVVVSGSGTNELTLRAAKAGRDAGAVVIAVTSFGASPLVSLTDIPLIIASVHESFRDELQYASRIAHTVFLYALTSQVITRLGAQGQSAHDHSLAVLADSLTDGV